MTDKQQHPITPPLELVQKWTGDSPIQVNDENWAYELYIAHQAARWGADQELEACCEWLSDELAVYLRTNRRPKEPPSLKEQALQALTRFSDEVWCEEVHADFALIQCALEQLDD